MVQTKQVTERRVEETPEGQLLSQIQESVIESVKTAGISESDMSSSSFSIPSSIRQQLYK
jgi:hypothetical protein